MDSQRRNSFRHSANGYLLDTFLQSKTKQHTDEDGGSVENRFRLLKEVVEGVTAVPLPKAMPT